MTKKILVTLPLSDEQKVFLESRPEGGIPCTFVYKPDNEVTAEDLKDTQVVIGCIPPALYKSAPQIEWVQLHSAGYENYAVPGVLPSGCILTNASGAYGLAVSEHMLAMTFDLLRHFAVYHRNQTRHLWKEAGYYRSVEGSVVTVLGLGDIGGAYARKMKAMGAYVIGVRKHETEKPEWLDEQVTSEHLDEVLPRTDILGMVVPGGPETRHILNAERLALMKDESMIINVGRGNAIDADALKQQLAAGKFYGVALDVTDPEPLPADDPLWDVERVLITPHAAGRFWLPETVVRILKIAAENLYAYTHGGKLRNVVN